MSDAERFLKVGLHKLTTTPERDVPASVWLLAAIALDLRDLAERRHGPPAAETEKRQPWPFCRDCNYSHDPARACPEY